MQAILGYLVLLAFAWACSEDRRAIRWRTVGAGIALQLALALLLIAFTPAQRAVLLLNGAAEALQTATDAGTAFLFGYLGGGPLPFPELQPGSSVILAFKILPLVLVISALSAVLFHWGVLQRLVALFAAALRRAMGLDGPVALAAAVHIFVGMIEAPLLIRPYLAQMGRGELFAVMSCGMAGVAGTVMVIYATVLGPVIPGALGVILTASVISTPAALAIAALMLPFGAGSEAAATLATPGHDAPSGTLDAIVRGTADGVGPLVGITTTLLVAVALVSLVNQVLGLAPGGWTLQSLFALPFRPVMWLIGIPWHEAPAASLLMGTKTVLNEFVAYLGLAALPPDALAPRSRLILTYAMCGFANFGSLGILVGGLGALIPGRRAEVAALGLRSVLSGTLATLTSGALAGLLS
ncbi:MAG TPA: nucleoside transporter C-terminal domain-containing protein [Acetobacteraceae bacterium]